MKNPLEKTNGTVGNTKPSFDAATGPFSAKFGGVLDQCIFYNISKKGLLVVLFGRVTSVILSDEGLAEPNWVQLIRYRLKIS